MSGLGALILNLVLSVAAGAGARQWAVAGDQRYLGAAVTLNIFGFVALAWVIKSNGLGVGTALALAATIAANTLFGIVFFGEKLSGTQAIGIALAFASIAFLSWRTA